MTPGLDSSALVSAFTVHSDKAKSRLKGVLIGDGVTGSVSPFQFESEADALGTDLRYGLLDTRAHGYTEADIPGLLKAVTALNYTGMTITHPWKEVFAGLADKLTPEAQVIGAINTLVRDNGQWVGHNTDWSGFAQSFERELGAQSLETVLLIGAGGAGRALAYSMLCIGVGELLVYDLDVERAKGLVHSMTAHFLGDRISVVDDLDAAVHRSDGMINATTVGLHEKPGSPIKCERLRPELWVADIVVSRRTTDLIRDAEALGCPTMDGLGMVALQAAHAFELFTGKVPDAERMIANARAILRR